MLALVVQQAAYQIHWIEVGGVGHGLHGTGIVRVDLDAFQDLQRCAAVLAGDDVRTAAGFALIADHTANAHGTIQLCTQHLNPFLVRVGQRHLNAQSLVQEVLNLIAQLHGRIRIQPAEIVKHLVPELQSNAHEHLLVLCCDGQELFVSHVVDILDGHQLFLNLVQVVDKGAVTGGAEQQAAIVLAERLVVLINGYSVRCLVLICEGDVVLHPILLFISREHLCYGLLEELRVLRRDGYREVAGAVGILHILLSLNQMLRNSGAHFAGIPVELEHALGFGAIRQAGFLQQGLEGFLAILGSIGRLPKKIRCIEGKVLDAGGELCAGGIGRKILPCLQFGQAAEHVLEHAGRCAGSRDKLALALNIGLLIIRDGGFYAIGRQDLDSALRGCGANNLHPGETALEAVDLTGNLTH